MPHWGNIFFCFLGFVAVGMGINIFQQNMRSRKWSTTKGKILESAVTGFDEDFITVKYEYTVMGVKYIGDRFNISRGSVGCASEIIKSYKPGAIVDLIYNPVNPSECALVRDSLCVPILCISVGIGFLAFGVFLPF